MEPDAEIAPTTSLPPIPCGDCSTELRDPILCRTCGYILFGLRTDGACPECGTPIAESLRPAPIRGLPARSLRSIRQGTGIMAVAVLVGVSGLVAVVVVGLIGLLPLIAAAALAVTAVLALDDVTRGLPELQAQFPWAGALSVLSPVMSFLLAVGAAGALAIGFGSEIDSAGVLALRCFAAVAAAAIPLVSALPVISYLRMIRALLKGLARSQAQAATGRALWAVIASAAAFPFLIVFLLVTVHSERLTLGVALSLPCVCVILLLIALAAIHREVGDLLREATIAEDMKATAAPH